MPFYPGHGRKQAANIDISSWTNKAHIIVPDSKPVLQSIDLKEKDLNIDSDESDTEEMTEDIVYLERHSRAHFQII